MGPGRQGPVPGGGPEPERGRDGGESMLRGGLRGIAVVTAATIGVALVAAVLAVLVALLY